MNQDENCTLGIESLLQRFDEKRFALQVSQIYFDRLEAITKLQDDCKPLVDGWVESYILNLSKKELGLVASSCDDAIAKVFDGLVEIQESLLSNVGHSKDKGKRLIKDHRRSLRTQAERMAKNEISSRNKEWVQTLLLAGTFLLSGLGAYWSHPGQKDETMSQATIQGLEKLPPNLMSAGNAELMVTAESESENQ